MCKKLLIVDDDSAFVYQLMNNFMKMDLSISLAESLSTAKNMINNICYDIILANTRVPGGNSFTLKTETDNKTKMLFMSELKIEIDKFRSIGEKCLVKSNINKCGVDIFE